MVPVTPAFLFPANPFCNCITNCQRIKLSVSEATHTKTVGLIAIVHVAGATEEVQVPAVGSAGLSTAPVGAEAASVEQRAIAGVEVAGRQGGVAG